MPSFRPMTIAASSAIALSVLIIASLPAADSPTRTATTRIARPPRQVVATRPVLSDDEYKTLADELRAAYSKPQDQWPAANVDAAVKNFRDLGPLPAVTFPADNPYSKEK